MKYANTILKYTFGEEIIANSGQIEEDTTDKNAIGITGRG